MKQDDLREMRKNITALIDDIKYHSDGLTDLERLPVIQLKVILAKINKLTEKTTILLHYVEKQGKLSDIKKEEVTLFGSEMELSDELQNIPEDVVETPEEEINEIPDNQPVESRPEPAPNVEKPQSAPSSSSSRNVEDKLKKLVVNDLNSAIGINEKYLYAGELFKGDTARLKEVISAINKMQDSAEVVEYIGKLQSEFNWDADNEIVKSFIELVERKFDQF